MISDRMQTAFNDQINAELYSSYLYLSMAAYFESTSLSGFANWMKAQAREEHFHAMKMYNYLGERGGRILLQPIQGPETEWASPLAVFAGVAAHEAHVTGLINKMVSLARAENDYASESFLSWFVDEQVEEEQAADEIVQKLKLMEGFPGGLFMLDRELAQRVFVEPAAPA